jgi:S1-C subfamily serine protease
MGIITCYTLIRTSADITKLGESSLIVEMKNMINNSIPISTKWLLDAVGEIGRSAINSVCLIVCTKTNSKGTGFLIKSGHIITNWHVIRDCNVTEVVAISSNGKIILFQNMLLDKNRDLAILKTTEQLGKGLEIIDQNINVGTQVLTWGYPLGYNGPPPILSVGYLAGFSGDRKDGTSKVIKHYVINAAFNPGNSGGPLFISGNDKVVGVVVAKHAPITSFLAAAIETLSKNSSGIVFTALDEKGSVKQFVESQLVAIVLEYFKNMTQVVIGEAIAGSELIAFLKESDIDV